MTNTYSRDEIIQDATILIARITALQVPDRHLSSMCQMFIRSLKVINSLENEALESFGKLVEEYSFRVDNLFDAKIIYGVEPASFSETLISKVSSAWVYIYNRCMSNDFHTVIPEAFLELEVLGKGLD